MGCGRGSEAARRVGEEAHCERGQVFFTRWMRCEFCSRFLQLPCTSLHWEAALQRRGSGREIHVCLFAPTSHLHLRSPRRTSPSADPLVSSGGRAVGTCLERLWRLPSQRVLLSHNVLLTEICFPSSRCSASHSVLHKAVCFHGFPSLVL